jgi:thiamine-phosphate pyrophosphorylase
MALSKLILLTHSNKLYTELDLFMTLQEIGIPALHVRKEENTLLAHQNFLNRISKDMRNRTVVHSYPELVHKYKLNGIHYKSTDVAIPIQDKICGKSVHTFEEAYANSDLDYLYFSPVFESISKKNYIPQYSENEIKEFLANWNGKAKIYALGGIDTTNAQQALDMGFYGIVVMGAIWNGVMYTKILNKWEEFKKITNE